MKTPSPTPAQAVVLEALRIAEEAKTYVNDLANWREGDSESGSAAAWQSAIMSIDRLAALAQPPEAPANPARSYALNLAKTLWQRHYKTRAPNWMPLDDTLGLLTQIDNMVAGITKAAPAAVEVSRLAGSWSMADAQAWGDRHGVRLNGQDLFCAFEDAATLYQERSAIYQPLRDERIRDAFMTTNTRGRDDTYASFRDGVRFAEKAIATMASAPAIQALPINMVLHCPACGTQHIDAPEEEEYEDRSGQLRMKCDWTNPPHRSHLCHACEHVWRPADVPTNGVAVVKTAGKNDSPAPQVTSEAPRLVGGEAAWKQVVAERDGSTWLDITAPNGDMIQLPWTVGTIGEEIMRDFSAYLAAQAASTDAPGEPDMRLRNLQTWLVCREIGREIGSALAPSLETVQGWMAALSDVTGEAPPDFIMKASKRDNSRCKFAAGGACCSSHCGDPACLASAPPTATDAHGVREAPEVVANDYARIGLLEWAVERWRSSVQNRPLVNVHRRIMDDCWRSVMRYAGGDPEALVGPSHDELLSAHPTASTTAGLTEAAMLTDAKLRAAWESCEETGYMEWVAIVQRACAEKWNVRLSGSTESAAVGIAEAARAVITARDNYGWSTEVDEKIEALRARIAARAEPRVSTSGYLQTVSPSPPTTLHWDDTPAAADGPTDKRITELWNFSTGGSFVPEDTKAFARAVWDAAIADQAHLLAAGAEQESRYATMIGEISDALGFTETEQFEAEGADKILASIAALRATAAVPAADHAWRVGEFVSSARPPERVLMLAVGRRQIGEYGMHGDFVRWIATSASAPQVDKSADLHGGPVDEIAETHGEVVYAEFAGAPTVAEGSWGWACARDSGSRCKTHCGLAMCMQADQSGLSPADAAMKPSYGIDGPHDGTDHHQIWKRAQRQEGGHD